MCVSLSTTTAGLPTSRFETRTSPTRSPSVSLMKFASSRASSSLSAGGFLVELQVGFFRGDEALFVELAEVLHDELVARIE